MLTARSRHHLLQRLFWNPAGARVARAMIGFGRRFDVVVRNYSLNGDTNGERWLLTLMDEAPLAIDVGFHDGASSLEMLKARPKARVIGFDPSRFAQTEHAQRFAHEPRVELANVALSHETGVLTLYDYGNMCNSLAPRKEHMGGARATRYEVPATTLDAYVHAHGIGHINLMKVDAEGYDINVLEGARGLLARQGVDIFMFEFASGWAASKRYLWEAVELMQPLPYKLFHLYNGFLSPLVYDVSIDSCTTLSAMYVGVSDRRLARGDIAIRDYRL